MHIASGTKVQHSARTLEAPRNRCNVSRLRRERVRAADRRLPLEARLMLAP